MAPQLMFELILFLLLHDGVRVPWPGICFCECDKNDEDVWQVNVRIASLVDADKIWSVRGGGGGDGSSGERAAGSNNQFSVGGISGDGNSMEWGYSNGVDGSRGEAGGEGNFGFGSLEDHLNITEVLAQAAGALGLSQDLLLDINDMEAPSNSSMDRLADRLSRRYLGTRIECAPPESKNGVRIVQRSFKLPPTENAPTVVQGVTGTTYGHGSQQNAIRPRWLLVGNLDAAAELCEKLKTLSVPVTPCTTYDVGSLAEKYQVALLYEGIITAGLPLELLRMIAAAAVSLVVVTDIPKLPADMDDIMCGVKPVACVSANAPLIEVFSFVQVSEKE